MSQSWVWANVKVADKMFKQLYNDIEWYSFADSHAEVKKANCGRNRPTRAGASFCWATDK